MKSKIAILLTVLTSSAFGTTIYFDDGTSIETDQNVYISDKTVYTASGNYMRGWNIQPVEPVTTGVAVEEPEPEPEEPPVEGPEEIVWEHGVSGTCATYEYQGPFTFGHVYQNKEWEQTCDTNGDGVYNFCEDYDPSQQLTFGGYSWIDWEWDKACR